MLTDIPCPICGALMHQTHLDMVDDFVYERAVSCSYCDGYSEEQCAGATRYTVADREWSLSYMSEPECVDAVTAELAAAVGAAKQLRESSYIRTFTGKRVWPTCLRPDQVCIEDIAHGLSNICRFVGQTREFYSVAQHSVLVAQQLPLDKGLWGLLHDASEAYLCDVARPVKYLPAFAAYRRIEAAAMAVICDVFGLPHDEPGCVRVADNRMCATEQRDLRPNSTVDAEPYPFTIIPMPPQAAKVMFLQTYEQLRHYSA
jgi:hypothetical protein